MLWTHGHNVCWKMFNQTNLSMSKGPSNEGEFLYSAGHSYLGIGLPLNFASWIRLAKILKPTKQTRKGVSPLPDAP